MTVKNILATHQQIQNSKGAPLGGGKVYLYEPNTTTAINTYRDSGLVTLNDSPVSLSQSGRASIWVSRNCDMVVYDRNGNKVLEELSCNPDAVGTNSTGGLVPNGSFETDADSNGSPDGWTRTNYTSSSNGIDSTTSTAGAKSFRMTSAGANGGGELETTDFFPVSGTSTLYVDVDLKSTLTNLRNIVSVRWYDASQVFISATSAYDSTANPTTFTTKNLTATPPGTARYAKIRLIGCDPSTGLAGSTYWDNINVYYPAVVSGIFGNLTLGSNTVQATNLNGHVNLQPNGTGAVIFGPSSLPQLNMNGAAAAGQLGGAGSGSAFFLLQRYNLGSGGADLGLYHSRGATVGTHTILADADELGSISFYASDGTSTPVKTARILALVDGAVSGAADLPSRLEFYTTPDGSVTAALAMKLDSAKNLTVIGGVTAASLALTSALTLGNGGTSATTAAGARTNLGVTATGADTTYNYRANNLSDVANAATARTNLGVTATGADTTYAFRANNLSDLASAASARSNLGVTATGADTTYAFRANNLSDLGSAATARSNLGLGSIATRNITISTSGPSGGSSGDLWFQREA